MKDEPQEIPQQQPDPKSKRSALWARVGTENNLRKYIPTGTYYAQAKIKGKRIVESLGTDNLHEARERWSKWVSVHRASGNGPGTDATMDSLIELWKSSVGLNMRLKPRTREYKVESLDLIKATWPSFGQIKVRKLQTVAIKQWRDQQKAAASRVNGGITVIRELLTLAESKGILRGANPIIGVKFLRIVTHQFSIPTNEQMEQIRASVYNSSQDAGLLFDLMAETGSRISTARSIKWEHVLWATNNIWYTYVKWKEGGYRGPITGRLRAVLEKAKPDEALGRIVRINSCRKPLETACHRLKISPVISHHDLRHWFVTRAVEKGVDVPTIARWVGHVDGGALLLQTYAHLRDEHSQAMAKLL